MILLCCFKGYREISIDEFVPIEFYDGTLVVDVYQGVTILGIFRKLKGRGEGEKIWK